MDQRDLFRIYRLLFPQKCANLKKWERRDRIVLKSGYSLGEAYGNLRKCWLGYKIAKSQGDEDKMNYYGKGIQKYQCELGLEVEDFPSLEIVCGPQSNKMEEDDDFIGKYRNNENAANESDLTVKHYDNYDDYLYSLPMGVDPISEK
jgi:hypothetical protein